MHHLLRPIFHLGDRGIRVVGRVIHGMGERRLLGLAAEMAYNNLLALFPTLVAILAAIGMLQIAPESVNFFGRQVLDLAPSEIILLLKQFVARVKIPRGGTVALLSITISLWVASGAVSVAMNAMDQIYQIPRPQRRSFWHARLVSILLTIATLILVLTASFLVFLSDWLIRFGLKLLGIHIFGLLAMWNLIRWLGAFVILAAAFGLIYRFGASRWPVGMPLIPGAVVGAILWAVISQLFRMYVAYFSHYNLTYGALSAAIVLMLWLNFTALAMLIGAQWNVALAADLLSIKRRPYV